MFQWDGDLKVGGTEWYMDSRRPRPFCFISHAHSDHLPADGVHQMALATPATAAIAAHRIGPHTVTRLDYHSPFFLCDQTTVRLVPAGHVLGSAMLHVTRPEGTLLYTGDFKLRSGLTVEPVDLHQIPQADVLVMESTYGRPFFHFPPADQVGDELVGRCAAALREGRQPIAMGYSLGKAQEIVRILTRGGLPVTCHGAVHSLNLQYEKLGVDPGRTRRYRFEDFHGAGALDLAERGVLVAPPNVARAGFATRFKDPVRIVMTGWALLKNAPYRYGVEHALPLSDHADFGELMELVERVRPKRIYGHHGYPEFIETLRARGYDAQPARPDAQLSLFAE